MTQPDPAPERTSWPYGSLFFFGFFGTGSPAGRTLAWRTTGALALIGVCGLGVRGVIPGPVPEVLWAPGVPFGVIVIGWAYARYLKALDELSRLIQLKAFTFAYGAAMTAAMGIVAWGVAQGEPATVSAGSFLWVAAAEPLRGVALTQIANRYE